MDVIHTQNQLIQTLKGLTHIAFVPTMGNLHEGHIKLIQEASKVSRNIVVSIFINPLQFNSKEDFKNYPRTLKEDLSILKELDISFVFAPSEEDILDSLLEPISLVSFPLIKLFKSMMSLSFSNSIINLPFLGIL